MKKVLAVAVAVLGLSCSAGFALNFDQGPDALSLLGQALVEAAKDKTPVTAQAIYQDPPQCQDFVFGPKDPAASQVVPMWSVEYGYRCEPVGNPAAGGTVECGWLPIGVYSVDVKVVLRERKPLLPWESDAFTVCLAGRSLRWSQGATAYDYDEVGEKGGTITLAPGAKRAQRPDPNGITLRSWTPGLVLTLDDKWASYYSGEAALLILKLKMENAGGADALIGEEKIGLPAAPSYVVDFKTLAKDFSQRLVPGAKYHVSISFRRLGSISSGETVGSAQTERVVYRP